MSRCYIVGGKTYTIDDEELGNHLNELRVKNYIRKSLRKGLDGFIGQKNTEEKRKEIIETIKKRMQAIMDLVPDDVPKEYKVQVFNEGGTRVIVSFGITPQVEVEYGKEINTRPENQTDESSGDDYS